MYGWNGRQYVQGYMPVYIQGKTALCTMVKRQTDTEEDGGLYSLECLLDSTSGMITDRSLHSQMSYTENCDQYHEAQQVNRWVPLNLWGTLWRNCQMVAEKGLVRQRSCMQEGKMAG